VESHRPNEIVKLLLDDEELEALQARGDPAALSVPPSGPASGMATPAGGRKPPVQVHGSWEAEDDGFFTGGRMQQVQQDEDIEFGGAGLGVVGSGMNTPGGFGTQTPGGPGGEGLGPRGGKLVGVGGDEDGGDPPAYQMAKVVADQEHAAEVLPMSDEVEEEASRICRRRVF
jgi:hypothetical protein